jgi:hypothetical protein
MKQNSVVRCGANDESQKKSSLHPEGRSSAAQPPDRSVCNTSNGRGQKRSEELEMPMKKRMAFEEENIRIRHGHDVKQPPGFKSPASGIDDRRDARIGGTNEKSTLLHGPEDSLVQVLARGRGPTEPGIVADVHQEVRSGANPFPAQIRERSLRSK